ncbi:MAG: cAMP/cGMP-dependent 3',5'-cyclic-AMP/GMP phosphodiesterase [Spirochaetes bacterium]|nr:cAMP/cGMP-dependent 3',5'-cyclic-AMP/GMP phosphodiesterase [Spirochaetota bacterium]
MNTIDIALDNNEIVNLPRGGYLINTPAGLFQFGSPPETIKDTIPSIHGVPTTFILPSKFFNWIKGISIAELEFPIYYNYFIKKKKTRIICNRQQEETITVVLKQSLFGPDRIDFTNDFPVNPEYGENIKREMEYFRIMKLEDVVEFSIFNNSVVTADGIKISIDTGNNFEISWNSDHCYHIPGNIEYKPKYLIGEGLSEPFKPPLFGMTCLGPSSGFDPEENTSGFILWINHTGIMIDPPVNSTEWLLDSNVSPKFIDSIILTHCHADHDAGTFQKILEEEKITIYTTETILNSFLKKYSALTDVSEKYLRSLFDFYPIVIEEPLFIHGACFKMIYSLHSIPSIGFRVDFQNKSLAYSSDHNNDPTLHKKLYNEGIIDTDRYNQLKKFPWDSSIIFHESGLPPLHTPMEFLDSLPTNIKKSVHVYHIPAKSFPKKTALRLAKFGIENTIYFNPDPPEFETSYRIIGLLKHIDLFKNLTVGKVQEFISIVQKDKFKKNDIIIKKGTTGDKFYIIYSGNVAVFDEDGNKSKVFGAYDYFGETALLTNEKRTKNVIAITDVALYYIEKTRFFNFIKNTEIKEILTKLVTVRNDETWKLFNESKFIKIFTPTQRILFETLLNEEEYSGKGTLIKEGKGIEKIYIIRKGNLIVKKGQINVAILQHGDLAGMTSSIYYKRESQYSYEYSDEISLYSIDHENYIKFLEKNPGLIMKLDFIFEQYLFFQI